MFYLQKCESETLKLNKDNKQKPKDYQKLVQIMSIEASMLTKKN